MKNTIRLKRILLLVTLIMPSLSFGQHKSQKDSLHKYSFKELSEKFYAAKPDSLKAVMYAKYYIKKAQRAKDTIKTGEGNYYLSDITKDSIYFVRYWNDIIEKTNNSRNKLFPAFSFQKKGDYYFHKGIKDLALNNYLSANKYITKINNDSLSSIVNYRIGLIKNYNKNYTESIKHFKKSLIYFEENSKNYYEHCSLLFNLSSTYLILKQYDSAYFINNKVFHIAKKNKDSIIIGYTYYNKGTILLKKDKYTKAINLIQKSIKYINLDENIYILTSAFNNLGKAYNKLNDNTNALKNYLKVDSLFLKKGNYYKSQKPTYKFLANYYKEKNNDKKQLEYINKYIKVDSVLRSRANNIDKSLTENYDVPNLKAEKKILEERLKKNNSTSSKIIMGMSTFTIVLALFLVYQSNKKKRYKKRLLQLKDEVSSFKNKNKPTKEHTIPKKVFDTILQSLIKFEENSDFLLPNITLTTLSKSFETNAKYLSQVINQEKGKSFNNYINELRINYTIEKLKTDLTFRKYSIKAIANEVGFNTSESFSKAFYKNTGIRPSYFIKELENL